MALTVYVLTGYLRHDTRSNEAALKYFLLGAFSSAIILYGMVLLYGVTGSTNIYKVASFLAANDNFSNPVMIASVILLVAGFAFKVAAVPFHMWAPDAYEGAPTSITAFMAVGSKGSELCSHTQDIPCRLTCNEIPLGPLFSGAYRLFPCYWEISWLWPRPISRGCWHIPA